MTAHNFKANESDNAATALHSPPMQYRKLRAPKSDGETLHVPALGKIQEIWEENLSRNFEGGNFQTFDFSDLRQTARAECAQQAYSYTNRYLNINLRARAQNQFVYSGHQPALFHPGVWYKNFALSQIGKRLNCMPINLIIDNDICGINAIRAPVHLDGTVSTRSIPIDAHGDNIPFESRKIVDRNVFDSFAESASSAIRPWVDNPVVKKLWPNVIESIDPQQRLGHAIASGRHLLENELGLRTLELPISRLAQTKGFASFVNEMVERRRQFVDVYNQCLKEYRRIHKIRSRSHPVPELEIRDEWFELPFWIWHTDLPIRRNLFCRVSANQCQFSDGSNIVSTLESESFVEQFCELQNHKICVRPKALMTTMFSRLVLSDLFLHGIGGSKYDQMTDSIVRQMFDFNPPTFLTLTATFKLPTQLPITDPHDVVNAQVQLREMQFHPEKFIATPSDQARNLIDTKYRWINKELPQGQRRERHCRIDECNRQLQGFLVSARRELKESSRALQEHLQSSQILGSREFSFCLFPESLPKRLVQLAEQPL